MTKIKTCIQVWKSRNLSLRGKVLIIKAFLISQIGYGLGMNGIPKNKEKEINTLTSRALVFKWHCRFADGQSNLEEQEGRAGKKETV